MAGLTTRCLSFSDATGHEPALAVLELLPRSGRSQQGNVVSGPPQRGAYHFSIRHYALCRLITKSSQLRGNAQPFFCVDCEIEGHQQRGGR